MSRKRANGQGCIYFNKQREKWIVSITLHKNNQTGKFVRKTMTCRNKQHAEETLERMIRDKGNGIFIFNYDVTIEDWTMKWLRESKSQTIEKSTYNNYLSNISNHIVPILGSIKLHQLRVSDVQYFYNSLYEAGLNAKTVQRIHVILSAALDYAIVNDLINKNPTHYVKRKKMEPFENRPYSENELRVMLEKIKDEEYFIPVLMLSILGLRRSELLALTYDDIDWDENVIRIRKSLSRVKDYTTGEYSYDLKSTKTISSKRIIGMNEKLKELLLDYKERQSLKVLSNPHNLIFCKIDGGFINPGSLSYHFSRILERHSLRKIRLHDLRHSFGMIMIRNTSLSITQALLGHTSVFTTLNIYNQVNIDEIKNASKVLDNVF